MRIRNGESDGIIVNDLDRYSRDVLGANLLLVEIKKAGGTLVSVHENIDITTPDGKMMFDFRMAIAENYLARSREKWAEAQRHAVEKGIYTEGYVPPGYEKREDRHLYLSPDAPIISRRGRCVLRVSPRDASSTSSTRSCRGQKVVCGSTRRSS